MSIATAVAIPGILALIPGIVALLVFLLFTYLYEQSRQPYFRAWQIGWGAYCLHYALDFYRGYSSAVFLLGSLLLVAMALSIFVSTRLMRERFRVRWYDVALGVAGTMLAVWNLRAHYLGGIFHSDAGVPRHLTLELGLALVLGYSSFRFYHYAHQKGSLAFNLLAIALALWAVLMGAAQFRNSLFDVFGGHLLGPIPQMLLGIAMVMVLFENERNAVQENALAFSTLGVDPTRVHDARELVPSMASILERLVAPLPKRRAILYISQQWRSVLPSVQRGFSPELLDRLENQGAGEFISELAYRRGGFFAFRELSELTEPLPAFAGERFEQFKKLLDEERIRHLTAVSLQTREHNFGVILFPHAERRMFGSSNLRLLIGLALQIGLTLENYVVMHDAQRRTKEYELLTEIGQAISSRLDQDEILRTVQKELGQIFDTSNFYITFQQGDEIQFELEVENGEIKPKRARKVANELTEYIIRTGQPLLIRSDMEKTRERLGLSVPSTPAKCFCGAPILLAGKPAGVMVALSVEREYAFEQRDLDVLQTAAGQVSVAVENARLFAEEQRRSRQFAFLNNISKTAISSEDAEQMLAEIVAEIQKNFHFDHIGIGILDYITKEIEIKAEAGATRQALGRRIPLGVGIVGRVARTSETALVQNAGDGHLLGVLPESRAVLCIPISYSETLLGVLNVESHRENAFAPQDVLILNTLADLLATALHNSFVFQKLQQQSITDGLTGIKTRRFFWEALTSEWKRASRSGRPFSVVLIDLDKFKEVNDSQGHLEGDLVLARVGRLLEQKCRQSNVVARYGGDEFIILMPETGIEQAQILAERLRLWVATDPMLAEHKITGSFGVASFPVHGFSVEDIIRVADAGMYVSKREGGNRVSTAEDYDDGESAAVQRQLISGYIEGFLQREHTGPEHLEELIFSLQKFSGGENSNVQVLREAIEALSRAAESREVQSAGHGDLVARYTDILGRALGMPPEELTDLVYAARVHDLGKLFVPERILNKPAPLTDDEFYLTKVHARMGAEIIATLPGSERMRKAIEHHHESLDGSGYPGGLRGEQIPLWARILSLADAFVNMTSERAFASAKSSDQALAELERLSGIHYDGMLVRLLIRQLKTEKTAR
ncbi:MAG: diguanylate cyclase [Acidobacteria bacterium]|nr:diguanylate cyclase [Acidobacteriota bacterium]MBV9480284.1 diguanylate cyclase [Acidobacteriota bacterium]